MRIILLLSILLSTLSAQGDFESKVGTTAAKFLNIPVGSRSMAMGEAFVAVANDESAIFWNPAGLVQSEQGGSAIVSNLDWLMDLRLSSIGLILNTGNKGVLGLGVNTLDLGEIAVTTIKEPNGNGTTVNASELALSLSYGRYLTGAFALGFTGKWIHSSYANETASGFAFDIGTLYNTGWKGLRVGMSLTNFGTKLKLDGRDLIVSYDQDILMGSDQPADARLHTESWNMPTSFRLGIAMDVLSSDKLRWTVSADGTHATDLNERAMIGSELSFGLFSLRGGFGIGFDQARLSAGAGMNYNIGVLTIGLDYAVMTVDPFGLVHSVSVRIIP